MEEEEGKPGTLLEHKANQQIQISDSDQDRVK